MRLHLFNKLQIVCRRSFTILMGVMLILILSSYLVISSHQEKESHRRFIIDGWEEIDLVQLAEDAERIFSGRISQVMEARHPEYPNVKVTYVSVAVEEVFKGDIARAITFMQFGGRDPLSRVPGVPVYQEGEEVVLFLNGESQYGLTSPVGGSQGKFIIATDPISGRRIISRTGMRTVFRRIKKAPGLPLSNNEQAIVRGELDLVDYTTFASLLRKLVD